VPDPRDVLTNARIELARFPLDMLATAAPSRLTTAVAPPPRAGELSGLDIVTAWVEHDRLHLTQLGATLARLWASRWAPCAPSMRGRSRTPEAREGVRGSRDA
jgi:hypothetical protein